MHEWTEALQITHLLRDPALAILSRSWTAGTEEFDLSNRFALAGEGEEENAIQLWRPRNRQDSTMSTASASVPTANGAKYLQQLCKHWSNKFEVELSDHSGIVRFSDGTATMKADANALVITIEADDEQTVERLKGVVARHLNRFAFREAPMPFAWTPA